jgi:hypothetical protein
MFCFDNYFQIKIFHEEMKCSCAFVTGVMFNRGMFVFIRVFRHLKSKELGFFRGTDGRNYSYCRLVYTLLLHVSYFITSRHLCDIHVCVQRIISNVYYLKSQ